MSIDTPNPPRNAGFHRSVRRVLWIEGIANVAVSAAKFVVGVATGSNAILGDALHSLVDVANNVLALIVIRFTEAPPDHDHPYGHQKFEALAIFVLGTLLSVIAVEIAIRAIERRNEPVAVSDWGLVVMVGVLVINLALSAWENFQARRLDSPLLHADARHTLGDALTTVAVIIGWQLSARGFPWLDLVTTLGISALVFWLAYGLFRSAIPILVDQAAADPGEMRAHIDEVPGVESIRRVRSRMTGAGAVADVVVTVDGQKSTIESHEIADAVELSLREQFGIRDVTVHVEPRSAPSRD